jgi:toxin ParE1/3/4
MRIARTPQAIADVDDIWLHIALDNPQAAERVVVRIATATDRLVDFPRSGPARPELGEDIRSLVVGSHLVLYRVMPDRVLILRVVHGARDLAALLDDGAN